MLLIDSCFHQTNKTASAGTEVAIVIPGSGNFKRRLTKIQYRPGATAHTLQLMRPAAKTAITGAATASDTTLTLLSISRMGGNVASGDYIVFQDASGIWYSRKVSGISTNTVTIPAIATDLADGTEVYLMGAAATAHNQTWLTTASALNTLEDSIAGVFQSGFSEHDSQSAYSRTGAGDPLLIVSPNGTNAGVFELVSAYSTLL